MSTLAITTRRPGVAQVTMNRPEVFNAFDEAMIGELDAAFARLVANDAVRVIVLAGAGRHFSAGAVRSSPSSARSRSRCRSSRSSSSDGSASGN